MKHRIILAAIGLLVCITSLHAQELQFDKDFHNFGKLLPNADPQVHKYEFKNTGNKPVKIKKVRASCGCTATDWTKSPVKPGQMGYVKVSFDPKGRSGYEQKDVRIITNAINSPHHVLFEAYIHKNMPKNRATFDYNFGNLSLNTDFIDFGNLPLGTQSQSRIKIKNDGDSTITIEDINTSNKITSQPATPFKIKGGETQPLTFTLVSHGSPTELGIYEGEINIRSSEYPKQPYPVMTLGIFYPNIPKPEEGAKTPEIAFKSKKIEFGQLSQGAAFKAQFKFENKGDGELTVYKVQSGGCSCTMPDKYRDEKIRPGEKDKIRVKFDSESLEGPIDKKIYVFTNDPKNPLVVLSIKGEITP